MKLIFISGPSGSGKTTLSKKIIEKIKNGIVLNTDNYYKTGLISRLGSKFVEGYFDRSISFNYQLFKKDFNFVFYKGISINERSYNFRKKTIFKRFSKKHVFRFQRKTIFFVSGAEMLFLCGPTNYCSAALAHI